MSKSNIVYSDFEKLDIRVGKIVEAESPDWSKKLLRFKVDLGQEIGERVIFSGIKEYFEPEYFVNKKAMFVVNLEPKKMGEEFSQGMMLLADDDEHPEAILVDDQVLIGTVVR